MYEQREIRNLIVDERGYVFRDNVMLPIRFEFWQRYPFIHGEEGFVVQLFVHRIVAEAFYGKRPRGLHVRHLDDDPFHIHVGNIRWGSQKQNAADRYKRPPPCRQCVAEGEKRYRGPCSVCESPAATQAGKHLLSPFFLCSGGCESVWNNYWKDFFEQADRLTLPEWERWLRTTGLSTIQQYAAYRWFTLRHHKRRIIRK